MLMQDTTVQVRYAETDQMGIVYHANYFIWFEVGRTEWFRRLNQNYKSLEEQGVILPVIDVQCQYKKPALYDDKLIIRTHLHELKGVRLIFHYEIIREKDEELLARGKTVHAFVDKDKKPVRLKKEFPQLWDVLHSALE
ncbi:acyl-CoA thioesterase [Irregularibacter muris]|uniref:Acyl-CoA thioesterase n=1 Tax=Irregularibacter muris TaxID=1796619 RepID=A0AAE3HHR0_9FIRM|nr:thioesterase family protein [Irregularibacter muris]MCR1899164.1 acyl-CoA thioesterase [Irregularibacter muris]